MACASCAKKAAAKTVTHTVGAQQKSIATGINSVQSTRYEQRVYIGPEANLESLLPGLSYGVKRPGQLMYVARQDLDAFPELFTTREEWIKLQEEKALNESVDEEKFVEDIQEEATKEFEAEKAEPELILEDIKETKPKTKKAKASD